MNESEYMRLDKFLSDSSPYSRKQIRILAGKGKITVNGEIVKQPSARISIRDSVVADGTEIRYRKYIYLMMNKPAGYLSASRDAKDPVVIDLLPEEYRHFAPFPAGRLDKDTEGLLLLTNDGAFDHAVTSPGKKVFKRYFARLDKPAHPEDADAFRNGLDLGDFTTLPANLEILSDPCEVLVEIMEGKFHQVKRMWEKRGKAVLYLKRLAIGELKLDPSLEPGGFRELTDAETSLFRE